MTKKKKKKQLQDYKGTETLSVDSLSLSDRLLQAGISDAQLLEDVNALARYCWSTDLSLFSSECFANHLTIRTPAYHQKIYNALSGIVLRNTPDTPPSANEKGIYPPPTSLKFSKFPMTKNHIESDENESPYGGGVTLSENTEEKVEELMKSNIVRNSVVVEPREFGKSTKAMIYVMWSLLNRYKKFVIYISKSFDHAVKLVGPIKREFETNEMIRDAYGDVRAEKWTESEMEFSNGSKLLAVGRGQTVRGLKFLNYRPDLVILDDIEDDESVSNGELRLKLQEWLDKQVIPGVDSRTGTVSAFGTILHPDSLLANLSSKKNRLEKYQNFESLFFAALDESERSIWEEKFSTDQLLAERKRDFYTFAQERMNQPIPVGSGMFKKEYFKYFHIEDEEIVCHGKRIPLSAYNFYLTCDIAMTAKDYSDYTVLLVSAVSPENEIFVLEYTRERWEDPDKIMDEFFRLNLKYPKLRTEGINGVEEVAAQKWLSVGLRKEMKKRNIFFNLRALKADKDKIRRIAQLQPRFSNSGVYIRSHMSELEEELLLFPKSSHDDVSDALAYVLQIAKPGELKLDSDAKKIRPDYKFSMPGDLVLENLMNRAKVKGAFKEYQNDETYDPYKEDSFEESIIQKWNEVA